MEIKNAVRFDDAQFRTYAESEGNRYKSETEKASTQNHQRSEAEERTLENIHKK